MSSEATKSVIANCPNCKAVTKVSGIPESKESIRCPKCKQPVSLKAAKPIKDKPPSATSSSPMLTQPTAEDYQRAYKGGRTPHRRRGLWIGVIVGAGVSLFIVALILTFALPLTQPAPTRTSPHLSLLADLNGQYEAAISAMESISTPAAVFNFNTAHEPVMKKLADLNNQYSGLAPADKDDRDQVLQAENRLANNKRRYQEARSRLARLTDGQIGSTPTGSAPTAASGSSPRPTAVAAAATAPRPSASGSSLVVTTPQIPSAPAPTRSREPDAPTLAETEKVTLTLLSMERDKATKEFFARLQGLAGRRARILNTQWSEDLLIVELGPIADLERFAARLSFGQVTQLNKKERTITLLVRSTAVGSGGTLPELPKDPFESALEDLRAKDSSQRRRGAQELLQQKPNEFRQDAAEAIVSALADADAPTRMDLLRALGRWSGTESWEVFARYLEDESPPVRRAVLDILAQLRDPRVAEAIVQHNIVKDREAAGHALRQIGPRAEPPVLPLLKHEAPEVRLEACRILKVIGSKAAIPDLLKLTDEPKSPQATAAWDAIENIAARRQ